MMFYLEYEIYSEFVSLCETFVFFVIPFGLHRTGSQRFHKGNKERAVAFTLMFSQHGNLRRHFDNSEV